MQTLQRHFLIDPEWSTRMLVTVSLGMRARVNVRHAFQIRVNNSLRTGWWNLNCGILSPFNRVQSFFFLDVSRVVIFEPFRNSIRVLCTFRFDLLYRSGFFSADPWFLYYYYYYPRDYNGITIARDKSWKRGKACK